MDKTLHVPVDLHEALKVKAAQQRVTLAVLVERVLRAVVEPPKIAPSRFTETPTPAPMKTSSERSERELVYDRSESQERRR